nr:hypothetical protein Iba_chr02fCG4100 [Ipomoea batatas]
MLLVNSGINRQGGRLRKPPGYNRLSISGGSERARPGLDVRETESVEYQLVPGDQRKELEKSVSPARGHRGMTAIADEYRAAISGRVRRFEKISATAWPVLMIAEVTKCTYYSTGLLCSGSSRRIMKSGTAVELVATAPRGCYESRALSFKVGYRTVIGLDRDPALACGF